MNSMDLLEAMSTVDDELLQKARTPRKSRKILWRSLGASAACLCIAVGAAAVMKLADPHTQNIIQTETTGELTKEEILIAESGTAGTDPEINGTFTSAPFVMIEITAWAENGFDGFVPDDADSDLLDAGSAVAVVFLENVKFSMPMDAYGNNMEAELNASNAGAGTVVKVQFDQMETQADDSVTLYANAVIATTISNPTKE